MSTQRISERAIIPAPPAAVYATIADYRNGHPAILPTPWFQDLVVEHGGVGAGTVIRFTMRVLGSTQTLRATITEPVPGRVFMRRRDRGVRHPLPGWPHECALIASQGAVAGRHS